MSNTAVHMPSTFSLASRVKDYFTLTKFTLSFTVVFTCVVSYLLAPNATYNLLTIIILFVAGLCVTCSAIAINQTVEKDTDALMRRTAKRPMPAGRISEREAWTFIIITATTGVLLLWFCFNMAAALLSLFSLFLYSFIYTPLKKVSAIAVLVGAIPGALPNLIGWVAATGVVNPFAEVQGSLSSGEVITFSNAGGYVLFLIQFLWQFPHFWAIAWLAHSDYTRAGFKLLPNEKGPNRFSAVQAAVYSLVMIPVGMLPYYYHISGILSFWILLACNLWMVAVCIRLIIKLDKSAARAVMFSAYFYLMVVFLAMLIDKV